MIRIAILTVGRSDFSILLPLSKALYADPEFDFGLWVGGAHYDAISGYTVDEVRKTGLPIWHEIKATHFGNDNAEIAKIMAQQMEGIAEALGKDKAPDIVLVLGDRYEAISACLALTPFNIPIGHISGGSVTHGAMDDAFRHCITKLSHIHFCEIEPFKDRILQLGEEPGCVHVVGALGLDGIISHEPSSLDTFCNHFRLPGEFKNGYILSTLHPETRSIESTQTMVQNMIFAVEKTEMPVIYTYPNADPGSDIIIRDIQHVSGQHPHHAVIKNFGSDWFYTAMHFAKLVVGNSSSGIIEAGSFQLPVVDIGARQAGRFHGKNVIHSDISQSGIMNAIKICLDKAFLTSLSTFQNPYGDGKTTEKIIHVLKSLELANLQKLKVFIDYKIQN